MISIRQTRLTLVVAAAAILFAVLGALVWAGT